MLLKMNKKKLLHFIILVFAIVLVWLLPLNKELLLAFNLIFVVVILINSKFSIISLWTIITNYVLLNLYVYDLTGVTYGVLGLTKNIDFETMLSFMLFLNLSFFFWSDCTYFRDYEVKLLAYTAYNPGKNFTYTCCILAMLMCIIAFPQMPFFFSDSSRFEALLPGHAWNHFVIVLLIAIYPNLRSSNLVKATYIFSAVWFLSHYERVDILGLIVLVMFLYLRRESINKNWSSFIKILIVAIVVFVVMSFLGDTRTGTSGLQLSTIFKKILSQNTACDVGYGYHASIDYMHNYPLLYGKTYLRYLVEAIPTLNADTLNPNIILGKYYWLPGGSFILSEPIINFGLIGVIILPNIYMFLVNTLIRKKSNYRYMAYLFLIATSFRYLWYGINFIETGMLWIIPFVCVLYRFFKRNKNAIANREISH